MRPICIQTKNPIIVEKELMLFDRIALERHDYTATKADRMQNAKTLTSGVRLVRTTLKGSSGGSLVFLVSLSEASASWNIIYAHQVSLIDREFAQLGCLQKNCY